MEEAQSKMQAGFTILNDLSRGALNEFTEALDNIVLPLTEAALTEAVTTANETTISNLRGRL
eukprot:5822320-Prymnesium_polylepis.1